jgi:hypothetical protein
MKLGVGMIATLAALVLGLLTSSAKGTFDTINRGILQTASKIVILDRSLAAYGPEAKESREVLKRMVRMTIDQISQRKNNFKDMDMSPQEHGLENLNQRVGRLSPTSEEQKRLQLRALTILGDVAETRLFLTGHIGHMSFPMPLVVLLVCWLTVIFFCFSLLSRPNLTVIAVLLVCVISATSSLYLIMELDQPFGGLIKVSTSPLETALAMIR